MKARYWILGFTVIVIFLSFRYLLPLVLPFALAYIFAKLISPVIHWTTQKLHINKKVCAVLIVLICVLAVGGFLVYTVSAVISQAILLLQKFPVYEQLFSQSIEDICCRCDRVFELAVGTSYQYVEAQTMKLYHGIETDLLPKLSGVAMDFLKWGAEAVMSLFIFLLATLLILLDDSFPHVHRKFYRFVKRLKKTGLAYIRSQAIIIFIIAVVTTVGLWIMGNDYAVLFGIGIAVFDAFPVVGSGIILVPWAIVKILSGNWFHAAILITVFVIATFLREVLEPKLFAKDIGLKPLFVLLSVYAGIQLFQAGGILLGPIALTVLKAVNDYLKEQEDTQPDEGQQQ